MHRICRRSLPVIARRAVAAAGGVMLLAALAASPAAAQYVCTSTATDLTCTNSGTAGAQTTAVGANQNATTTNSGSSDSITTFATTGNATTINSGLVTGVIITQTTTGNATTVNSGSVAGVIDSITITGNATTTNTGSVGGDMVTLTTTGNATTFNSGSVASFIDTVTTTGNATTINSGSVAGFIDTVTTTGSATTINSGSVAGLVDTITTTGAATLTNSGTILGPAITATTTGNATTINSGTLASSLVTAATNGNAALINSGTIRGTANVHAGGIATVTNSGTISDFNGTAIQFSGGADTLNLLAGSTITGAINLIGVNDTVNFLSGNHNLTFNTLAGATVNGPDPFVVSGNRAAAIDPTPFGLADKNLMDFTRGVSGMLDSIGGGAAPSGPISSAFAPSERGTFAARVEDTFASIPALAYANDNAMVFKAPSIVASDGRAVWARGFGGERTQDGDGGALVGARTTFLGGAVGFDLLARPDLRLGLFAGGGESRMSLDTNLGFTHTDTAFGGLYGRWGFASFGRASFLDFALHGGGSGNSMSRTVNNNLIAGGIEIATASYNSSYISPELKYGIDVPLWAQYTLTPSVRVRYVAGFFGGYTEAGTTAPLTVNSRTIQDLEERGELKLTRAMPVGPDLLLTSIHVGAIGLERVGDTTVSTVLLGINLPFVTPGRSDVAGVVGGGGFEWRTREGVSVFGAAEAIGFSDQSTVWSARGGLRVAF